MGIFESASLVVVVAAAFGFLNQRSLRLPPSVALTLSGGLIALAVSIAHGLLPENRAGNQIYSVLTRIDFKSSVLNVMLSFLLFAGALHIKLPDLKRVLWLVTSLATLGALISTLLIALGLHLITGLIGPTIPFGWCLVFGALISPTDPVAVIALMQRSKAPALLRTTLAAESLFNDGVGIVLFTVLLGFAQSGAPLMLGPAIVEFIRVGGGGLLFGLALGGVGLLMMRLIDDYETEALICLALVMGGYVGANAIGVSGPVAIAVAGIMVGNIGVSHAMSAQSQDMLLKFWDLIELLLNAALFLLLGIQGIGLLATPTILAVGTACIPMVLLARGLSLVPSLLAVRRRLPLYTTLPLFTWGGLRGGLCIAMALSTPAFAARNELIAATYLVAVFSVVVQGLTLSPLLRAAHLRPS